MATSEQKEFVVARVGDLEDGEMKQVSAGETDVLLVRTESGYIALGATCTHYGAPLADGVLNGDRLVCPWHHACFDVRKGAVLEPPALDALACYDVRVRNDEVVVVLTDEGAESEETAATGGRRSVLIVGGGAAGYMAAQTLREDGFDGRVVMLTREEHAPYDRPNLSKDYLAGNAEPEWIPLRGDDFYERHAIEVRSGTEVLRVDVAARQVELGDGSVLEADAILIATGGEPRRLDVPGANLEGIFTLRSLEDADRIIASLEGAGRAVVVGASFIGMEVAASLTTRGLSVTVVAPEEVPFEATLGADVGRRFQRVHEEKGVTFRLGSGVAGFEGDDRVRAVLLDGGDRLDADIVVVGVGVRPATGIVAGVAMERDGGIPVDERMRVAEGVWAAGDVASFPDPRTGERVRIEHWRTAEQLGRVAAHDIAGHAVRYDGAPFFWTRQFDAGVQYVGHASGWDDLIVDGSIEDGAFLALYAKNGRILAAAGTGRDRELGAIAELLRTDRMPSAERARAGIDWVGELRGASQEGGREAP